MTVRFESSRPGCSRTKLEHLQRELGVALPEQYAAFLTLNDGAVPESNFVPTRGGEEVGVSEFLSCDALIQAAQQMHGRMPEGVLPVAHAEGGNYIALVCSGRLAGAVFFWDHELESDEGEPATWSNLFKIDDSFDSFLARLEVYEPVLLQPGQVKSVWIDPEFLAKYRKKS